jgi:imidazolonepropionase-like amidohydrolase
MRRSFEGSRMKRTRQRDTHSAARRIVAGVVALWAVAFAARAAEGRDAFVGARLVTISGPEIEDGVLVVAEGRIEAVGGRGEIPIPADARIHELPPESVIMPGLVDTHSHIGRAWAADSSEPIQPDVSVIDAIDVRDSGFQRAQAGGITTANLMPGSGHLLSGQTVYLKMRDGDTIDDLLIRDDDGWIMGGMKMANGTNSRKEPPFPGTRGKSAALVREQFVKAVEYRDRLARAGGDSDAAPERDLAMEALVEVLDGKRIVHHHTHRHDDILTVLRLKEEFGFRVVLHHVSEGWKVADRIAEADVPSSIIVVDSPGGKLEARDLLFKTGAALERAGARVAYHTDDWITDSRLFLRSPALGVRAGMSREAALASVTLAAAEMLDLDHRIGSLEVGKGADLVVLSGDPLSVYTRIEQTWVDGAVVFDRTRERDGLWAVGGWGAGEPRAGELCCYGAGGWE